MKPVPTGTILLFLGLLIAVMVGTGLVTVAFTMFVIELMMVL